MISPQQLNHLETATKLCRKFRSMKNLILLGFYETPEVYFYLGYVIVFYAMSRL
jgi:hypothetical protein